MHHAPRKTRCVHVNVQRTAVEPLGGCTKTCTCTEQTRSILYCRDARASNSLCRSSEAPRACILSCRSLLCVLAPDAAVARLAWRCSRMRASSSAIRSSSLRGCEPSTPGAPASGNALLGDIALPIASLRALAWAARRARRSASNFACSAALRLASSTIADPGLATAPADIGSAATGVGGGAGSGPGATTGAPTGTVPGAGDEARKSPSLEEPDAGAGDTVGVSAGDTDG